MVNYTGQCRCGNVQFELDGDPLVTMACHCTGCQRMTSSAFSLSSLYSGEQFKVTQGTAVLGGLRKQPEHYFCPDCMSWLFTRTNEGFVNVRATLLSNAHEFAPFIEAYTIEKLPWAITGASRSYEKFPAAEEWPLILEEYAKYVSS